MPPVSVISIVEGHGEVFAVPVLIRRLGEHFAPQTTINILPSIRRSRDRLLKEGELEKDVQLAAEKLDGPGIILILLNTEGDCPAQLGPMLLGRAVAARPDRFIGVALAHVEYESWFLASAESLRGRRGLSATLTAPTNPETIRGAKEWLRRNMTGARTYSETADQVALTAVFDIDIARTCKSFDRLCRLFQTLIEALEVGASSTAKHSPVSD